MSPLMMPNAAWMFQAMAATYILTAATVIVSRARYDRRCRLLQQVEPLIAVARGADASHAEAARQRALALFHRRSLTEVMALAADPVVPAAVQRTIAESLIERLGLRRLLHDARSRPHVTRVHRQVTALRALADARVPEAWPSLEAALADGDADVKAAAVALLGRLGNLRAGIALIRALERNLYTRSRIATALDAFPVPLGDRIVPLLTSDDPLNRYWAATLMRRYRDTPRLEAALARLASDPEALVRRAAVETIGACGFGGSATIVRARLTDSVPFVRAHAARALSKLEGSRAAHAVLPLLADPDWTVRNAAKHGLESMGSGVTSLVIGMLGHRDAFARNGAAEVLQNLGVFDSFVASASAGSPADDENEVVRQLASAGGTRMWTSAVARLASHAAFHAAS